MKRILMFLFLICAGKLLALSTDDYIIQQVDPYNIDRPKIFLSQIWGEAVIEDKLVKSENLERWEGYKDVVKYYYENIEITTTRLRPNVQYRRIVDIVITGKKYTTMSDITVGDPLEKVFSYYGEPNGKTPYEGSIYYSYWIRDPHVDHLFDPLKYNISFFTDKNNVITKIIVHYIIGH